MSTIRKTVTFTTQQDEWIKAQIEVGDFTNDSGYLRHLVREDLSKNSKQIALKLAIQNGIESSEGLNTVSSIMKNVESKMKEDGRL